MDLVIKVNFSKQVLLILTNYLLLLCTKNLLLLRTKICYGISKEYRHLGFDFACSDGVREGKEWMVNNHVQLSQNKEKSNKKIQLY